VQDLPLIAEPDFIISLMRELPPSGESWECSGLQALANLAWGLALATLRMAPTNLHPAEGEQVLKTSSPFSEGMQETSLGAYAVPCHGVLEANPYLSPL
jgi:hypothetical protein